MKPLIYIGNKLEEKGGAPTFKDSFVKLLRKEGFEVKSASALRNKVLRLLHMLGVILFNSGKAETVLIDTYSTQNFWYAVYSARLCRLLNLSYIPVLHGGNLSKRLNKNPRISKSLFGKARVNVAPSAYLYENFGKKNITNLVCIPNAVAIKHFPFTKRESIKPKILWVRAFDEIYNPMLAIRAFELIREDHPEAELCMVGPDKDGSLKKCREYADSKGLPIKFTGKLKKKKWVELSKDYHVFLNTSNIDNTPVSLIEAMALGFPVISTNVGGIPFLIASGENGLLVPPNNEAEIRNRLELLINNPSTTASISLKARAKAETFNWEKVKQEWVDLLS